MSVISHGHGVLVQRLLQQLADMGGDHIARVVLTHNIPEAEPLSPEGGWPFRLDIVRNPVPRGFGANHNQALAGATEPFVCVINPDVALLPGEEPFSALLRVASEPGVGCAYPLQRDEAGTVQDSEREMPSPMALWRRRMWGATEHRVDWVNAACLVLPTPVWQQLGGFDEGYFLYCEDVDLCLRLRLAGLALVRAPAQVVHAGQRDSHRRWRHLQWHLRSLWRLWRSPVFSKARGLRGAGTGSSGTIAAP